VRHFCQDVIPGDRSGLYRAAGGPGSRREPSEMVKFEKNQQKSEPLHTEMGASTYRGASNTCPEPRCTRAKTCADGLGVLWCSFRAPIRQAVFCTIARSGPSATTDEGTDPQTARKPTVRVLPARKARSAAAVASWEYSQALERMVTSRKKDFSVGRARAGARYPVLRTCHRFRANSQGQETSPTRKGASQTTSGRRAVV
jgi:hypothetical protein